MITQPEESYGLRCVVACDLGTSSMRRPWPVLGHSARGKINYFSTIYLVKTPQEE